MRVITTDPISSTVFFSETMISIGVFQDVTHNLQLAFFLSMSEESQHAMSTLHLFRSVSWLQITEKPYLQQQQNSHTDLRVQGRRLCSYTPRLQLVLAHGGNGGGEGVRSLKKILEQTNNGTVL